VLQDREISVSVPGRSSAGAAAAAQRPAFGEEVLFLRRATSYPPPPSPVEPIETHTSWVFLTGDRAYKLHKPRLDEGLDRSHPKNRRRRCEEELRLNSRLAPGVYLRVEPLTQGRDQLEIGGEGEVVDWLLLMRRLPADRMLDQRLACGELRVAEVRQLGEALARFHAAAPRTALTPEVYRAVLGEAVERHFRRLSAAGEALLPRAVLVALCSELLGFLSDEQAALDQRVLDGRVVEGHGDLRPEHVCLLAEPVIIDCAVDPLLRRDVDTLDELACLAMECERVGAEWVGAELLAAHARVSGDVPLPSLMSFYKGLRAAESAGLALGDIEAGVPPTPRDLALARMYAGLAARCGAALR
jgi:uncharacterized protein